jgi:threonine/homoserine/homoserine lactone efflux protein
MIPLQLWLAYAAAATTLIVIPGPTTLMVTGHAMSSGSRVAMASLIGVALGDIVAMTASVLGFGAVLAASAEAFTVLKWAGAAYLVYLGVRLWLAPAVAMDMTAAQAQGARSVPRAILQAFSVTVLNPKGILFFAAFMPQFIDPKSPTLPQVLVLGATFVAIAIVVQTGYIAMMARARRVAASPRAVRIMNRVGGSMLIGAGLLTATLRQR